jgi:methylenetetrahydrofolate reductase (NADPH)
MTGATLADSYALEMTAKDISSLKEAAPLIPAHTVISVTALPDEAPAARVVAAAAVRRLGFEPMLHFAARRILSQTEFETNLQTAVDQADISHCFLIAGDPATPLGPYADSAALLQTGAFERAGVKVIGIAGHPEGHPNMSPDQCWSVLGAKVRDITQRGMAPLIVTQFSFDSDAVLGWLAALRQRGIETPVRIGVPGPASIRSLLRFATRCGVAASTAALKKYGISITNILGSAGPDNLLSDLTARLGPEHGQVQLQLYPFGGLVKTADYMQQYQARHAVNHPTVAA